MGIEGYIYIMMNPSLQKDMLKVGMTTRSPDDRAKELSSDTGVAAQYIVAYEEFVPDFELAEKLAHRRLAFYRTTDRREFFSLPLNITFANYGDEPCTLT